ncbi:MAG: FMN-binding protein [Candidatus Nealsonbacteria bacterium]|nr:FMN-binding protein [Candidatus Nealsonbacteria bacterium]
MSETPEPRGYLSQAWLVILLALVYGGALAGVQTKLQPMIDENKRLETYRQIPALVGIAESTDDAEIIIEQRQIEDDDGRKQKVYLALVDGKPQGWVLPAGGMGFADRIELLIGLDPAAETITGLWVLDQKETPGLGDLIRDEEFRSRFVGKSTGEHIEAKPEPKRSNEILTLTGATISSRSVAEIVNQTVERFKGALRREDTTPTSGKPDR